MTCLGCLLASLLFAQTEARYVISGVVVHGLTGQPLSRARVLLAPSAQRTKYQSVVTGADGRFRFEGLSEGKYSLQAERLGFLRQGYRQRSLFQAYATAVVVGPGEAAENLVFRMIPGSVIAGYVLDSRGEPVHGVTVQAMRIAGLGSLRRVQRYSYASTDDRGYYRIHSLADGNYALAVAGRPWQPATLPVTEPSAYPVTYFPSATHSELAKTVGVRPGEEVAANFTIAAVPAVRVAGRVALAEPAGQNTVSLSCPGPYGSELALFSRTAAAPSFEFPLVPLGHYYLNVWNQDRLVSRRTIEVSGPMEGLTAGEPALASVAARIGVRESPPAASGLMVLTLRAVDGGSVLAQPVDAEGRAVFPAVIPGRYEVWVGRQRQMAVTAIGVRGAALAGGLVEIPETGQVELDITVDGSAADVNGRVLAADQPHSGVWAMLAPRAGWDNLSSYRFDQSDSDGTFTWFAVPRGEYLMFALEEGEPLDYADPDVIRKMLSKAQPLTIGDDPAPVVRLELRGR
jgi:hypothetical protein